MNFIACLVIAAQAPIEVPFKIGDEAIIVEATINGRKASLMFDTGFSGCAVVDEGLNIGSPTGKITLRDFVGEFQAETVKVKTLALGQLKIPSDGMEAVKRPGAFYSISYNTHCTGIMGFEVIKDQITEINFQKSRFIFHPQSVDISKRVPDNKTTFLAKLLPIGHNSMEMLVEVPNGKKMTLALDTGNAFFATTHRDVLERVGLWEPSREPKFIKSAYVASGEVSSWYAQMPELKVYGIPVPRSTWSIIDLPSSSAEHDGTVGFGFLKNFNITIDFSRRRVWFENFTGKTGNDAKGDIGVSLGPSPEDKSRILVYRVAPGSPAEKAGIKRGDAVLSVDGHELADIGPRRLSQVFEGDLGTKVNLAISRKGELMRMDVERVLLVNEIKRGSG